MTMGDTNKKVSLEDIIPLSKVEELLNSANKITELNEEKFNLLINFLEENREELIQRIDITKYLDHSLKIKEGKEEEFSKASFPESLKFCEEKKREYYENDGIFLGENLHGLPSRTRSFFGHDSSYFHKKEEMFYIPSTKDFLEVKKNYSSLDRGCFVGHIHITETLEYSKVSKEDAMKAVNLLKLTKTLKEFLSLDKKERHDFSSFYNSSWFREYKRKRNIKG